MKARSYQKHLLIVPYFRIAAISIIFVIFVIFIFNSLTKEFLKSIETARRASLTQLVHLARNGVEPVVEKVRSGTISRQEGVLEIRGIVRRMVYEDQYGKNYIFMSAYDGTMLVQPYEPKKELTSQWNLKDSYGTFIIQELIRTARSHVKGGFVRYHYPPPNSLEPQEKLAFVIGIPELNCYIGTGMYLQAFHKEQQSIIKWAQYSSIIFVALVALLALLALREMLARNNALYAEIQKVENARKELRELEEKYRSIFNNVVEGIFQSTTDGKFLTVNPALAKICGYASPEEMIALVNDISHQLYAYPHQREKIMSILAKQERVDNFEIEILRKGGTILWASLNARAVYDNKGDICYYEGTFNDISERKRAEGEKQALEQRLNRAEKMEALGTLAGGVAHDLNNVLGVVVGYAELALGDVDESSPLKRKLETVMTGGLKAAAIVDDLLTLARRGVSGSDILNLNKIIADFQKSPELEKLYTYHPSVKIKTDMDNDLLNISGSSVHLSKSLYNLISNAAEAISQGGNITIKTANQSLDKSIQGYENIHEGDYVVLSISDTGEGISETNLKHIFEPFYTKKRMGRSGTGLGLAVVWGTVKDHHGYINVESETGKGTTFILYFPVTREDIAAKAETVAISTYMGKGESILIVDDIKEQRDLAAVMLKSLNHSVTTVESGEDAVAYLKNHQVDLIILDMIMDPGMDGLDTYTSILNINPKQKAIIVSGYSESERVKSAKQLGAGAYVRKPYIKEKLGLAVRKELDRK